jgi:hypothetical protein
MHKRIASISLFILIILLIAPFVRKIPNYQLNPVPIQGLYSIIFGFVLCLPIFVYNRNKYKIKNSYFVIVFISLSATSFLSYILLLPISRIILFLHDTLIRSNYVFSYVGIFNLSLIAGSNGSLLITLFMAVIGGSAMCIAIGLVCGFAMVFGERLIGDRVKMFPVLLSGGSASGYFVNSIFLSAISDYYPHINNTLYYIMAGAIYGIIMGIVLTSKNSKTSL